MASNKKRTSINLMESDYAHIGYLMDKNKDGVGSTSRTIITHMMKKLIEGDYDEKLKIDEKKLRTKLVYVDAEYREEAYKKAKELGYNNIGEALGKIIRLEKINQSKKPARAKEFTKVGEHKQLEEQRSDNYDNETTK